MWLNEVDVQIMHGMKWKWIQVKRTTLDWFSHRLQCTRIFRVTRQGRLTWGLEFWDDCFCSQRLFELAWWKSPGAWKGNWIQCSSGNVNDFISEKKRRNFLSWKKFSKIGGDSQSWKKFRRSEEIFEDRKKFSKLEEISKARKNLNKQKKKKISKKRKEGRKTRSCEEKRKKSTTIIKKEKRNPEKVEKSSRNQEKIDKKSKSAST